MATESSSASRREKKPEPQSRSLIEELEDLELKMQLMANRRRGLGEYNADSRDIITIVDTLVHLIAMVKRLERR